MFKKKISVVLIISLLLGNFPISFAATEEKWASKDLAEWQKMGLLKGDDDGELRAGQNINRAEFMALVNRMEKKTKKSSKIKKYVDVKPGDWYYDTISIALRAGYIKGVSENKIDPEALVTREEAMAVLSRISNAKTKVKAYKYASDSFRVSSWARKEVSACINEGFISGVNGKILPQKNITRAEAVVMLNRKFSDKRVYGLKGKYDLGHKTVKNVIVTAKGVELKNAKIKENLVVSKKVGNGDVAFDNIIVSKNFYAYGGGRNSIHLNNVQVEGTMFLSREEDAVRVVADSETKTASVVIENSAILVSEDTDSKPFSRVEFSKNMPKESEVSLEGKFDELEINSKNTKLKGSGDISLLKFNEETILEGDFSADEVKVSDKFDVSLNDGKFKTFDKKGIKKDKTNGDLKFEVKLKKDHKEDNKSNEKSNKDEKSEKDTNLEEVNSEDEYEDEYKESFDEYDESEDTRVASNNTYYPNTSYIFSEPTKLVTAEPTKPVVTKPTKPVVTKPTKPITAEPTKPVNTEPTKPVNTEPTKPVVTKPSKPVNTNPTKPVTAEPTKPVNTKPTKPVNTEPTKPVVTKPTKPVNTKPTKPVTAEPTKPVVTKPTKPVVTKPTKPVVTKPTKPITAEPTKPVNTEPTKPVVTKPTKPITAEPTKPVNTKPTKPVVTKPTKPVNTKPIKPVNTDPQPQPQPDPQPQIHTEYKVEYVKYAGFGREIEIKDVMVKEGDSVPYINKSSGKIFNVWYGDRDCRKIYDLHKPLKSSLKLYVEYMKNEDLVGYPQLKKDILKILFGSYCGIKYEKKNIGGKDITTKIIVPKTLEEFYGLEISWKSLNPELIDNEGNFIYPSVASRACIEITLKLGDYTTKTRRYEDLEAKTWTD